MQKKQFNVCDVSEITKLIKEKYDENVELMEELATSDMYSPYGSFAYFRIISEQGKSSIATHQYNNFPHATIQYSIEEIIDIYSDCEDDIVMWIARLMKDGHIPTEDLLVWVEF